MAEQLRLLPRYLTAHLQLTLAALLIAVVIAVPAGITIARRRRLETPLLGLAGVIQTIPGLALLAIMVPALAMLGHFTQRTLGLELRSIGFLPALIALTLYALLPILRNTVVGIAGVDPALIEAARGVGMAEGEVLRRVSLPLAMPVMVAGLRTAAVWVVGTATLSTPVGATSLGNFIFSGLQTRNFAAVGVGCAAAAALALLLDQLIRALETGLRDGRRARVAGALLVLMGLCAWAALGLAAPAGRAASREVVIGAKTFTEQYVLSELLAARIAEQTGLPTRTLPSLGSTVAFDALRSNQIDVYVEYSGTIYATLMHRSQLPEDRARVLAEVAEFLRSQHGIPIAAALGFENTYALGMRAAQARELGIQRISQLAAHAPKLEIGGDYEFFQRPEWSALQRSYGLAFRAERSMDSSLMYQAVAQGEVDVITAFSTDGRIAAEDIALLEDDRGAIPPYDALVLVGPRAAREQPQLLAALAGLAGAIDAASMRRMNLAVDRDGRSPAEVAREFLSRRSAARASAGP
jgi:osmoprotectant transport system permease protein